MAILTWNEKLSVGVPELDNQHKKLIDLVNNFFEALKSGSSSSVIGASMPVLQNYVNKHFAEEEAFMKKIGYPKIAEHHAIHVELGEKVEKLSAALASGKEVNALKVGQFFKNWLVEHIVREDSQYGKFAAQMSAK